MFTSGNTIVGPGAFFISPELISSDYTVQNFRSHQNLKPGQPWVSETDLWRTPSGQIWQLRKTQTCSFPRKLQVSTDWEYELCGYTIYMKAVWSNKVMKRNLAPNHWRVYCVLYSICMYYVLFFYLHYQLYFLNGLGCTTVEVAVVVVRVMVVVNVVVVVVMIHRCAACLCCVGRCGDGRRVRVDSRRGGLELAVYVAWLQWSWSWWGSK